MSAQTTLQPRLSRRRYESVFACLVLTSVLMMKFIRHSGSTTQYNTMHTDTCMLGLRVRFLAVSRGLLC